MISTPRFLVAEDDPDLRVIISDLLATAFPGARIATFVNGQEALREFDRAGADFVVSNHAMPVMNGPEFVRAVRERDPAVPILMVSGSPEARGRGLAAGISTFLHKEHLSSHFVAAVRELLTTTGDGAAPPSTVP